MKAAEQDQNDKENDKLKTVTTATAAAGWAKAAAATVTAAAATAAEEAERRVDDTVDEAAQAEINLRVAASKGDMVALAIAEQAHCYYSPSPSPSSLRVAPLHQRAKPFRHTASAHAFPDTSSPHCVSRPWSRQRWTLMPLTGCVLPCNPIRHPHPPSPLRSRLSLSPLVPRLHLLLPCLTTATHGVCGCAAPSPQLGKSALMWAAMYGCRCM